MSGSPSAGVPIPIDPVLLHQEALPARTDTGVLVSQTVYEAHLQTIKRKEPLQSACAAFNVRVAKAASLSKLRAALVQYWYSKAGLPALSHPSITTPQGNAFSTAHLSPTSQPSTSTQPHDADPDEFNNGDNVDDIDDAVERANAAIAAAKLQRFAVSGVIDEISPDEVRQSRVIEEQAQQLALLNQKLDRRTLQWTPPKAFLADANGNTVQSISRRLSFPTNDTGDASTTLPSALGPPALIDSALRATENTGVYIADDSSPRAFIVPSPNASSLSPRPRTNIDLVLPPLIAFCNPGEDLIWPVCLGPDSADWASIFEAIKQPQLLWNEWKPARPLDHMSSSEIWCCYNDGEQVLDKAGTPTGIKPPLRSVEQHFHAAWRKEPKQRKAWQRFSVIPKWIENTTSKYSISPKTAIARLDEKRMIPSKLIPLRTNALVKLLEKERKEISLTTSSCAPQLSPPQTPTAPVSSPMISSSAMSPVSRSLPPSSPCSSSPIQPTSSAGKRPAPAIPTHPQLKRSKTTIPVAPIVAHYDFV